MDNITHTLIGAAVGEAFFQVARKKASADSPSRFYFYLISMIANNFPDLDLLYRFLDTSNLGYLLHHRGHTHTFIWLWPQLLILFLVFWVYLKYKKHEHFKKETWWLFITGAVGLHLHILMDYFNSYGVHPFHPFNNEWFYGDSIFIIEPLFWALCVPLMLMSAKSKWKYLVLLPTVTIFSVGLYFQAFSWLSLCIFGFTLLTATFLMLKLSELKRPFACILGFFVVISVFSVYRSVAYNTVISETKDERIGNVIDVVLAPLPSNPFCWTVIFLDGNKENYRIHRGILNLLPKISGCPDLATMATKEVHRVLPEMKNTSYIDWIGFYKTTYGILLEEIETNCELKAWFQFARAPLRNKHFYSDVRFPGDELSFASMDTSKQIGASCPPYPAPWVPPFDYEKYLNSSSKNQPTP